MSLSNVRSYLKTRMDSLGYSEWRDGFKTDNIPETISDLSYHILVESIDGGAINHTHQETFSNVSMKVFYRGYRDVTEAIDTAILGIETIVKDICKVSNRTNTVLNVVFNGVEFSPINDANDNSVLADMDLTVRVVLGVEED